MADPFDYTGDPSAPGMFGQSQNFWRGLADFGFNMASAASQRNSQGWLTNGTGLGGIIGAAGSKTMQDMAQNAETYSKLKYQQAQTLAQQVAAAKGVAELPLVQYQTQQTLDWLQHPEHMQQYWQQFQGQQQNSQGQATPPGSTGQLAPIAPFNTKNLPSGVTPDMDAAVRTTIGEAGGEPPAGQQAVAAVMNNRAKQSGSSLSNVVYAPGQFEALAHPDVYAKLAAIDPTSPQYQSVLKTIRPIFTGDVPDPTAGATHFFSPTAQAALGRQPPTWASGQTPLVIGNHNFYRLGYSGAPAAPTPPSYQVAQAGGGIPSAANPQGAGLPPPQAGGFQPGASPQTGGVTAQGAPLPSPNVLSLRQRADQLEQQQNMAKLMQQRGLPIPMPPGDPQILRSEADKAYQTELEVSAAGQKQAAISANENMPLRGPGSAVKTPTGQIFQTPIEYNIVGPDNREWRITQNAVETGQPYVKPADVPDWVLKYVPNALSAAPTKLAPGEEEAQKASAEDAFGEKARAQYASALGTRRSMEDMETQLDTLNAQGPSWYNTGAGGQFRLDSMKVANAGLASIGLQPWYDTNKVAAGEDLVKQTKLAGLTVLNSLQGAQREAAQIIVSTQSAVPNIENTPQGAKLVLNGIKEAANWTADQHAFMANWYYQHNGNMVGADVAFNQSRPAQLYARRGISMVRPYEVSDPKDFKRFLPGTQIYLKGTDPTNSQNIRTIGGDENLGFEMTTTGYK